MSTLKSSAHILLALLLGFGVAVSLFIGILAITSPTEPVESNEINLSTVNPVSEKSQPPKATFDLGQSQTFIACVEKHKENVDAQTPKSMTDAVRDCSQKETPEIKAVQQKLALEQALPLSETPKTTCELAGFIPYFCTLSKQFFIQFIYLLQFCALWIQTSIVMSILLARLGKQAMQDYPAAARWAIDAPPILGVIGTLYAFSVAATVGTSGSALRLSEGFRSSFEDAVLTTMIGGSIYVINLALNILKDSNAKVS